MTDTDKAYNLRQVAYRETQKDLNTLFTKGYDKGWDDCIAKMGASYFWNAAIWLLLGLAVGWLI